MAQDVLLQGFYWNVHPGDLTKNLSGGVWYDSLRTVAPQLAYAGFKTVWIPSPAKGTGGNADMGYGINDYYDLGNYINTVSGAYRTRFGNRSQLDNMVSTMHQNNVRVMVDIVLNHRFGGDPDKTAPHVCNPQLNGDNHTVFTPGSGRFPGIPEHFNPTYPHCDVSDPYHNAIFGQDIGYFANIDQTPPPGGWYFGPHNVGTVADSLITWGRWMMNTVGFDEMRIDAIKHIEPGFLAPFLVETKNGEQPFTVGEFYDGDVATLKSYQSQVNSFNSTYGSKGKNANLAMFDFSMYFRLKSLLNDGTGGFNTWDLSTTGLNFNGVPGDQVVTFLENHDFDRGGFKDVSDIRDPDYDATCSKPGYSKYGSSCLKYFTESDHAPVFRDKHMGYALLMALPPRPMVFWKDYWWYGLKDEISWLMNLRRTMATGYALPVSALHPYFPTTTPYDSSNHGGNMFAVQRDGMVMTLNDRPDKQGAIWSDTPWANLELKDYSDAFMFEQTSSFSDKRAFLKANARNYAWYAPTGRYPMSTQETAAFTQTAAEGGKLHFVVLRAQDAANLIVGGSPLAAGDEIAVIGPKDGAGNTGITGIGRVGQSLKWDGVHDMLIEVLGNDAANNDNGRMKNGDPIRFAIQKANGTRYLTQQVTWLADATDFTFAAKRPATRGPASFGLKVNNGTGLYSVGGISVATAFSTQIATETQEEALPENTMALHPVFPNPFQTTAQVQLTLNRDENITVELFDLTGRRIRTLQSGSLNAGIHTFTLNGQNLPNGVYLIRATTPKGNIQSQRVTFVK